MKIIGNDLPGRIFPYIGDIKWESGRILYCKKCHDFKKTAVIPAGNVEWSICPECHLVLDCR